MKGFETGVGWASSQYLPRMLFMDITCVSSDHTGLRAKFWIMISLPECFSDISPTAIPAPQEPSLSLLIFLKVSRGCLVSTHELSSAINRVHPCFSFPALASHCDQRFLQVPQASVVAFHHTLLSLITAVMGKWSCAVSPQKLSPSIFTCNPANGHSFALVSMWWRHTFEVMSIPFSPSHFMGHVILLCALNSLQIFGGKSSFYFKFCPLHRAQVKLHKSPPPWNHTSSWACHIQTDPLVSSWNTFLGPNSHALARLCGWIFISGSSHKLHARFPQVLGIIWFIWIKG